MRPASLDGVATSSDAATRWASRLEPRTVRLSWVGRPVRSRPVNTRTSQTPRSRSLIVSTPSGTPVGME